MATTYAAGFTEDMIKDPTAPSKQSPVSQEKFFYDVFKPGIGGDAGLLSYFPSGGRSAGQVDGSPRVPDYNQFIAGKSTYSHRHDGKVYGMTATRDTKAEFNNAYNAYVSNINAQNEVAQKNYDTELGYSRAAREISNLARAQKIDPNMANQALANLSAARNFGASQYATQLNFQVSDQQIVDDLNATKLSRLNNVVQMGNTQIAGINERITSARDLVSKLPVGDPRRTVAESSIASMTADLQSVNEAIASANDQIKNFKPVAPTSAEGLKDIVAFREFIRLPEERAANQLKQIDPDTYETAVGLGRQYRQLAETPIGPTTTPLTEALRTQIEEEALTQLRLGATLGAEERRQYEQASRAAQTARGNIFGVAPAVEEAVTTGRLAEERKLQRYGAAAQFLGSGETTGAALARDVALRDALRQQRLGAAAGFIAGGPSIANLAQARTAQQQAAFQNYIQATQPLPGQFGQAPSTAQPFFQIAEQGIPVNLTNTFANLYGSQANYLANTYGAQVGAISRQPSGAQIFGEIAGGLSNLIRI